MGVLTQSIPLPAHDKAQLTVRFVLRKSVAYVDASALQRFCPSEVVALVETRLQFNHRRHLLSLFGRVGKAFDNGRLFANSVERLFNSNDVRIASGRTDKFFHRAEAIVRMVDQHIFL